MGTMPGTTGGGVTTQGVGTTAATTTTENSGDSSSSLLWLWILLGILALCCLLALCGGGLAACMGGKKKKKKIEEGDARQRACSCGVAHRRGGAGVVAHGTPIVGAVHDDADGSADDGGDGSDGANGHTYNGRDCRSDDAANADGRARSFSDADDGKRNGRPSCSNARDRWIWNTSSLCNAHGGKRIRHSGDASRALSDVIMWTLRMRSVCVGNQKSFSEWVWQLWCSL